MVAVMVGTAALIWVWSRVVAKRPTSMLDTRTSKVQTDPTRRDHA